MGCCQRKEPRWGTHTGRLLNTVQGHTHWFTSVAISSDGQYVTSESKHEILTHNIHTGKKIPSAQFPTAIPHTNDDVFLQGNWVCLRTRHSFERKLFLIPYEYAPSMKNVTVSQSGAVVYTYDKSLYVFSPQSVDLGM